MRKLTMALGAGALAATASIAVVSGTAQAGTHVTKVPAGTRVTGTPIQAGSIPAFASGYAGAPDVSGAAPPAPGHTASTTVRPAIDSRPCSGSYPATIEFYDVSGTYCYGGYVGGLDPGINAFTMHSGDYYGDFVACVQTCKTIYFRPNEVHGFGGSHVVYLEITPPF